MKTLEPLRLSPEQSWASGATAIQSADGKEIARVRARVDFSDLDVARRFVACVNACAGIPTEVLEGAGFVKLDDDPLYELVRGDA